MADTPERAANEDTENVNFSSLDNQANNELDRGDVQTSDKNIHQDTLDRDIEEEEEEETCGFCIFMKGGGCKDAFVAWSECVDSERESGSDYTEKCKEATLALRNCMLQHKDYYQPLLEEEEAAAAALEEQETREDSENKSIDEKSKDENGKP